MTRQKKRKQLATPGERFGRGVVVREYQKLDGEGTSWEQMRWYADLKCDCGNFYTTRVKHLYSSTATQSCGCLQRSIASDNLKQWHRENTRKS